MGNKMSTVNRAPVITPRSRGRPLANLLIDQGVLTAPVALGAIAEAGRLAKPPAEVIAAEALVTQEHLLHAQSLRFGVQILRSSDHEPDPDCLSALPAHFCLEHGVLPWHRVGSVLVIATARPDDFENLVLPSDIGPVVMALTTETDIHDILCRLCGDALVRVAETYRDAEHSCRDLASTTPLRRVTALAFGTIGLAALIFAPQLFFASALLLACVSLVLSQGLKLCAFLSTFRSEAHRTPRASLLPDNKLPTVSLLVPLLREADIAGSLMKRLKALEYPRSLLEVVLILEHDDAQTRAALDRTQLPAWSKVVTVPRGTIQTKPRAMNFALPFTRGDLIGVYDAEDAPARDQLRQVASHFSRAPPQTACVQGVLDFYNPRANWLARCFAIEYASWFRLILPGLVRMRLPVPLGGTTVFFRRCALEQAQGWDAHNVTEDADLGLRLARLGFRTDLLATSTQEEANNRLWPWVKQRSRWLKGYALTWWVHSRRPLTLWRDLGPRGFLGVQALFLGTLLQFALAPVLWSFWLIVFGLPHPLNDILAASGQRALVTLFLAAETISLMVGLAALARSPHRGLMVLVPTMLLYFPLGTIAIYKAFWEMITCPFYWDKTEHGRSAPDTDAERTFTDDAEQRHPS